jgi:hypothetical protein
MSVAAPIQSTAPTFSTDTDSNEPSKNGLEWVRCTHEIPCRHCMRSDHQCTISENGEWELCYRVGTGAISTKTDKRGVP